VSEYETPEVPQGPIETAPVGFAPREEYQRLLLEAMAAAGMELGAYDRVMVRWLAGLDWPTVAPIVSWLLRAAEAPLAARDAEVRAEALNDAADRIERRAAQLDGVWLRADQVCDTLRRLAQPANAANAEGGEPR
jgi:hypothetical protein